MKAFPILCFLLTFIAGCISSQSNNSKNSEAAKVKFDYFDNRILVPISINGEGPFYVIFDTGGSNMLAPEAVSRLNLKTKDAGFGGGAGDKQMPMQVTQVRNYQIGSLIQSDQNFLVMDLTQIKKAFNFKHLDGIIGYELLKQYVVTINYDDKKLIFESFENFKPKGKQVKFRFYADKPVIPSLINGVATEILLDTGDRSSFTLFKKFSNSNSLEKYFPSAKVISGYGVGGPIPAKLGKLPEIKLGKNGVILKQVPSRLPLTKKDFFATSSLGGSVGNGALQDYIVSFNYRDQEIILRQGEMKNGEYKFIPPSPL